jgi:hypothetical protein
VIHSKLKNQHILITEFNTLCIINNKILFVWELCTVSWTLNRTDLWLTCTSSRHSTWFSVKFYIILRSLLIPCPSLVQRESIGPKVITMPLPPVKSQGSLYYCDVSLAYILLVSSIFVFRYWNPYILNGLVQIQSSANLLH